MVSFTDGILGAIFVTLSMMAWDLSRIVKALERRETEGGDEG